MILEDIALTLTPGLGVRGAVRLLEVFASAEKIFSASREELIHFAELNPKIADSIVKRVAFSAAAKEIEHCRRHSITPITSTDPLYPPLLRLAVDYPHVIYVMGNIDALTQRSISIIGTRRITTYGDRTCNNIVRDLSGKIPNLTITSGLAFGVDSCAHRAAIQYGVTTVAVLASALPSITPAQHSSLAKEILERGGAIVSECHSQTRYHDSLYVARNRIIAALSSATIVVETPLKGGSIITADIASGYDRAVFAVPGRVTDINSAGCNSLIASNRAMIYTTPERLIRELMWDCTAATDRAVVTPLTTSLTTEQEAIVRCFRDDEALSIEELCERSGCGVSELSTILTELELEAVVRMLPGSRFELLQVVVSR